MSLADLDNRARVIESKRRREHVAEVALDREGRGVGLVWMEFGVEVHLQEEILAAFTRSRMSDQKLSISTNLTEIHIPNIV